MRFRHFNSVQDMTKVVFHILLFCAFLHPLKADMASRSIDVVIPAAEKDMATLNMCIKGIRKNCDQVGRIIVVSREPFTNQAEWFPEAEYPFDKQAVALELFHGNHMAAAAYENHNAQKLGWYYQQLLKLYAPFVIPNISSNVLLLDADTIFLNKVDFLSPSSAALYNVGSEYHRPYFRHAARLLPGLKRVFPAYSGICHHMLLQRNILEELFQAVEATHKREFWKAFCSCVDQQDLYRQGASEYEIYFNFIFSRSANVQIQKLKWKNHASFHELQKFKKKGYHYLSCHSYLRQSTKK